jgi:hypothetical protein
MRAAKTVFIVGAGASNEVGVPFGREFIEIIAEKLNYRFKGPSLDPDFGDPEILDVIQQYAQDRQTLNRYLDGARRIREGILFSRSIDAFIDVHRDDQIIQKLGKLSIAKTILEREQRSYMYISPPSDSFQDVQRLAKSWFVNLSRGLNEGVRKEEINRIFERAAFVVFNYDRCVEHFLYNNLLKHYGADAVAAKAVMGTLKIYHPYGKVADLPWESAGGIPFGFPANRPNLMQAASQIKTYTERIESDDALKTIRGEIAEAETLVFLGFSYQESNMTLLDPGCEGVVRNVFGTSFGISASDVEEIKNQVRRLVRRNLTEHKVRGGLEEIGERINIRSDLQCAGLLDEYSRMLFAAGRGVGQ